MIEVRRAAVVAEIAGMGDTEAFDWLVDRVVELQADKERLEALIRNRWTVGPSPHQQHGLKAFVCYRNGGEGWPECIAGTGETERDAIDDARAQEPTL